ncbi:hypothetical protein ACTVCO_00925 [Sanguibacter sp. A247]|uniref:hypothetical protein n=1 Tax=unclassified Sanguibacter TaxID=2645534 RepID=UPI003FD763EC
MVAQLLSLRWQTYLGTLRRSVWQAIGSVIAMLYALGGGALMLLGGLFAGLQHDLSAEIIVGGSMLVLGWAVGPLLAFGLDDTFDPRRLAQFPLTTRDLILGTSVATLLGPGGVFTVLAALGAVAAWITAPAAAAVALVAVPLGVVTAVVGGRATTSAARPLVEGRRGRDVLVGVVVLGMSGLGLTPLLFGEFELNFGELALTAAPWLSWTPFGAAFALPADIAAGQWGAFAGHLAIAVATPSLLVLWWRRTLRTSTGRPAHTSSGHSRGLGVLGRVPDSQFGAILARCLTYWVRDPRYLTSLLSIPVIVLVGTLLAGQSSWLLLMGPIVAWTCGWAISVDVALDSTAFWTHVAAPMRGVADRWARVVAIGAPALVLTGASVLWSVARTGRWETTPAILGVSVAALLASLGLASVVSALVVFPVNEPGDNPFASKQGGSMAAMISQGVGTLVLIVVLAPAGVLAVLSLVRDSATIGWGAAAIGLAIGLAALTGGVAFGARRLDATSPDLLERLRSF